MDFGNFFFILSSLTVLFFKDVVTGTSFGGQEKYEYLCSKFDRMPKSEVSEEQLGKLIENEMESEIKNILTRGNSHLPTKGGIPWYFNSADSDVIVKSADEIGEHGQLVRHVNVGTGESRGLYDSVFSLNQINHHFIESTVTQFLATIEASISASKKGSDKSESNSSNLNRKVRKSCQDIIKRAYEQVKEKFDLRSGVTSKVPKLVLEKDLDTSRGGGSNFDEKSENSTLIETQAAIRPNGYLSNIINVATGQASNSGQRHMFDFQSHGKYLESKVDITKLVTGIPISFTGRSESSTETDKNVHHQEKRSFRKAGII